MNKDTSITAMRTVNNGLVKCLDNNSSSPLFEIHEQFIIEDWDIKTLTTVIREANLKLPRAPEIIADTLIKANIRARTFQESKYSKIVYFKYSGAFHTNSKDFCKQHANRIYHIKEILELYNSEIEPSIIFGGGWGCYHYWEPMPFYKILKS